MVDISMNYYSGTDSEKLCIILSNQWFSLIVITVSQRVAKNQVIDEKESLQKIVFLSIIWSASLHNDNMSKNSKI